MNFHKTIGFLATLLLVLGIGVPDSFAGTTTLKLSRSSITEGSRVGVTITVTLNPAPHAATDVAVTVTATGVYVPTDDLDADPADTAQEKVITVSVKPNGTGTAKAFILNDANDPGTDGDDQVFYDGQTLTASMAAITYENDDDGTNADESNDAPDSVVITIRDNDRAKGSITLSADVPSVNANGSQSIEFKVALSVATGAGNPLTVTLTATHAPDDATETAGTVTIDDISIPAGTNAAARMGTVNATPNVDAGTITVVASAPDYSSGELELPVIARNAEDVEGFRVLLANPAHKKWAGIDDKVEVHVVRLGLTAYDWTDFTSIAVSLRDTSTNAPNTPADISAEAVGTVTAENLNEEANGDITLKSTPNTGKNKVTYNRADDKLVFVLTLTDDSDNSPANLLAVYAAATFSHVNDQNAAETTVLRSDNTKDDVFTSDAVLNRVPEAKRKVGDGNLIKVDVDRPAPSDELEDTDLVVTVGKKAVTEATVVKVGDVINVAVGIDENTRFRNGEVQVAIATADAATSDQNAKAKSFLSRDFDELQISDLAGDSLRISLPVGEGTFKVNPTSATAVQDRNTGKNVAAAKTFEVDGLMIAARVRTVDQAGNTNAPENDLTVEFLGDSRTPNISVIHPADGERFTGAFGGTLDVLGVDLDHFLNPLRMTVDEGSETLDSLYVYEARAGNKPANKVVFVPEPEDTEISQLIGTPENAIADTVVYDTSALKFKNAANKIVATVQGGSEIDLVIVAKDDAGNEGTKTLSGVIHDAQAPVLELWFPKISLLEKESDGSYLINNATRHPVLTLPEDVDSISVTYTPSPRGDPSVETVSGVTSKGETDEITITDAFDDGTVYTLTIFTRDLAGNAAISDGEELTFSDQFMNPMPTAFEVIRAAAAMSDSTLAGQAQTVVIQAYDDSAEPGNFKKARIVRTYKGRNDDGSAGEVRISAMVDDGAAGSVVFEGKNVVDADKTDGMATLKAANWSLGSQTVQFKSNKALDGIKILVEHRNAAADVAAAFDGSVEDLYVVAGPFSDFDIIANEDDQDDVDTVWGQFTLKVQPTDEYGNSSLKMYNTAYAAIDEPTRAQALDLLDTRLAKSTHGVDLSDTGVEVTFISNFLFAGLPLTLLGDFTIELADEGLLVTAPTDVTAGVVQVKVNRDFLTDNDVPSQNISKRRTLKIAAPPMPVLTLKGPDDEDLTDAEEIEIPMDPGSITVTVTAEGYAEGSTVTINGEVADDASAMLTISEAGDVTVSATADGGRFPVSETWTFVDEPDEPTRMDFTTADGEPVYLIDLTDNTVDLIDYGLFRDAWGKSASDDINDDGTVDDADVRIFLQADIAPVGAPDGVVDLLDYEQFLMSWNRTADPGPVPAATKPIVLLPGINENAEFSLSLGSERVVAGELVAVDVSLANVEALVAYGFTLNYDTDKFEFVSVAPADGDLLTSTGGESMLFHNMLADGQVEVVNGVFNGTAVSGGGDIVRFVFRVLREFEDNARFEIAEGLVIDPTNLSNPAVVAGVLELQSTPREFALHQNFPNPFNPDTTIKYDLAESADVTLQIYNVLGQVVRTLVASEAQNAGRYQIRWNGMDDRGVSVSSGVYFYRISAEGKFQQVQKLMLLK